MTHLHPYSPGLRHCYWIIDMGCQPSPQCQWNSPESRYKTTKNAIKCEPYAYQIWYISQPGLWYISYLLWADYNIYCNRIHGVTCISILISTQYWYKELPSCDSNKMYITDVCQGIKLTKILKCNVHFLDNLNTYHTSWESQVSTLTR